MLLIALFVQVIVQVLCKAPLPPPQNIHVNNWVLTWTAATGDRDRDRDRDITYTVQYRSFDSTKWNDVPACVQIPWNSCNLTFIKAEGEHGCVMLHVLAEKHLLMSRPVEACSRHGDSCTPAVSLTARPGSLTVHLSRNHSLALEHGDHAIHRVYYGKEGEPLRAFGNAASSVSIPKLQEGQRYCAKVQYMFFDQPVGLPSCTQCEVIPKSNLKQTEIIIVVVVVVVLILLTPVVAYIFLFQLGRIKQWLRPPYQIPDDFFFQPFPEQYNPMSSSSPREEHWDVISCITPEEFRD